MKKEPTFEYEHQFWQNGVELIAGIDEVGMGALAGPVIAAAIVLDRDCKIQMTKSKIQTTTVVIRDSKQMTERGRESAAKWIKENAVAWAVGEASVKEITEMNILNASHLAMKRAVKGLRVRPNMLFIDGRPVQLCDDIPTVNLVGGDALSLSIAAASIVAKVYRDDIMRKLDETFPNYGFASHKGYGAAVHMAALEKYGATLYHRPTYAPVARVLGVK